MKKRAIIAALCIGTMLASACGKKAETPQTPAAAQETEQTAAAEDGSAGEAGAAAGTGGGTASAEAAQAPANAQRERVRHEEGVYYIGIVQQADHESLSLAVQGFMDGMEDFYGDQVVFDYVIADGTREDCDRYVKEFLADKDDMIVAAGTRALESAAAATQKVPIIGLAVTDFIMCGAVSSYSETDRNVTGISDLPPMQTTKEVLESLIPEGGKAGMIISEDEINSIFQCRFVEEYLIEDGVSYDEYLIPDDASIEEVLRKASAECSALYLPADNRLATHMDIVKKVSLETGVPVMTSDEQMCRRGGLVTVTVDLYTVGSRAVDMATDILEYGWMAKLKGDDYDDRGDITLMSVDRVRDTMSVKYNPEMAEALGWVNNAGYTALEPYEE